MNIEKISEQLINDKIEIKDIKKLLDDNKITEEEIANLDNKLGLSDSEKSLNELLIPKEKEKINTQKQLLLINQIIKSVEKSKSENKNYAIRTIAQISYYIEKNNKKMGYDKIAQKLGFKNIKEIYLDKKNLKDVLEKLNSSKEKNEIQLKVILEAILNFYDYSEKYGNTKIDFKKDNKLFNKESKNFNKEIKEIEKKSKKNKHKNKKVRKQTYKNKHIENYTYNINLENFPSKITNNNSIVINGKTINNISKKEYEQLKIKKDGQVGNIDALKNLIDIKEKLSELGIEFAWEKRNDLIPVMKTISPFNQIDNDFGDSNLLTKDGFNNYLKFLIAIAGEKYSNSNITENYAIIRKINKDSVLGEGKNIISGFGPFGQKLTDLRVFNNSGIFDFQGEYNLRKILNKKNS